MQFLKNTRIYIYKKMKCSCKSLVSGRDDMLPYISSYFQGINRGSLLYPNDVTINLVLYNYIVINKLIKNPSFLHSMNQRKLSMYITLDVLANGEFLFHVDSCSEGCRDRPANVNISDCTFALEK